MYFIEVLLFSFIFIKVQKNVISAMFFPGRQIFFLRGERLKSIALGGHIYIEVKCKYTLKCLFTST